MDQASAGAPPAPQADAFAGGEPPPEEPFEEIRKRLLAGPRKSKGRRLVKPEESPQPAMTPEQRLLILDTWQRSGLPAGDFAPLVGLSKHTLYSWKKRFEESGPAGLMDQQRGGPKGSRVHELTKRTILMLKQANPEWGCQRISDMLLRGPALPASPGAVSRVLHEAGYQVEEVATHPHPDKQREFERATPNQLWQTDLFTFVLKRQNRRVYMVAFMDDHSRFITGYGIHASQSAALVLEVVRAAIVAYGTPQEILTDNGSQYVTWRGTSAFHREMDKRGIKHLVARPQRPQTLGKIERFWGTLWRECVENVGVLRPGRRTAADWSLHRLLQLPKGAPGNRRPGACGPLLRRRLRSLGHAPRRVAANALELARNGVPKAPFYVTGRIGERAFSVHAEGERMILKREGEARTEVDLGGLGAAELPLIDSAAAAMPAEMPLPICPDGSPQGDVVEDEVGPGESPLDAGLRRLDAGAENEEQGPTAAELREGGAS